MRAARFHGRGDIRIEDVATPTPGPGELLVKIASAGICGTDAHEFSHGPSMFPIAEADPVTGHVGPMTPGHELAGTVVSRGEGVIGFEEGALIVSGAGVSCGSCHWCQRGRTNLCATYSSVGLQRNGGLAEYCVVPASNCVNTSPYGLDADTAALAQPMAIATHAMRRGRLAPGDVAVIIGVGGIGAFLTYAAKDLGATVVVSDLSDERLAIGDSLGADLTINAATADLSAALAARNLIPTVVYEVSGTQPGFATAISIATRATRIVAVGLQASATEVALRDVSLRELEIIGTNALVYATDLEEAVRLLSSRDQPWSDVAPTAIPLDLLVSDGLQPIVDGTASRIKTLIDPGATDSRPTRMSVPPKES